MTLNNLGTALKTLGERESGTARLEEAIQAFEGAQNVYRKARMLGHESYFENRLNTVRKLLAERKG